MKNKAFSLSLFDSTSRCRTNEAAKPTIALDYNYAKKPKNLDGVNKEVGHIWELGDGTFLTKLIDVVLTPETIA